MNQAIGAALNLTVNQPSRGTERPFNTVIMVGFAFRKSREGSATKKHLILKCPDVSPIRRCNYFLRADPNENTCVNAQD